MTAKPPKPRSGMASEQVLGKAYDVRLMRRLWQFVTPHWRLLVGSLALIPLTVLFELVRPYLLKVAIDQYIEPLRLSGPGAITLGPISIPISGLATVAIVYVGFVLLWAVASFAQLYTLQLLGQRSMHDLRRTIYGHVISQRAAFFDRMPVGRLLTRMTNDVENINEMFAAGVITLVADLVKLVGIVVAMFLLDVELTLMTFLVLPILVVVIEYARRLMRASFREIRVKLAAMNSFAQEYLSGIKVVQLFSRERAATEAYGDINSAYRDAYHRSIYADASMYAVVEAVSVISIACIAWYASGTMTNDAASIGLVVAFIEYIRMFFLPVRDFSAKYAVMQSAMAAAERITALLDTHEPDAVTSAEDLAEAARSEPDPAAPAVRFRDVHFAYRDNEPILRGVGFDIARGQTVAVVGATGSGKSTLIKLLARLYEIDSGTIELAGRDIRKIPADELRRRITVVSQDVFMFSGTVRDNVELGGGEIDDDRLRDALERVGAARMLARRLEREERLDTDPLNVEIAERGSNFSAGERQLIAFARALVRDPDILVLDEATAHVDPEAESWIEQGVAELMRDRTTLVIAHRLSTIRNADQILVVSRGRIVETGTHDELVAQGGLYAKLERTFARKE